MFAAGSGEGNGYIFLWIYKYKWEDSHEKILLIFLFSNMLGGGGRVALMEESEIQA